MRTTVIIGLILIYIMLGIIDIKNHNISTGITAFLFAAANGLIFFAGSKT